MKRTIGIITGVISFICALGWLFFLLHAFLKDFPTNFVETFAFIAAFCFVFSTTVYVILTNFGIGITNSKEINKINLENQILKLQIEQKELKKKLGE